MAKLEKTRPVLSVIMTVPFDYQKLLNLPSYLGKRPVPPGGGPGGEVHVWSDNPDLYTIGYHPDGGNVLFYNYQTEDISNEVLVHLTKFINSHIKEQIIPANGFVNVSHAFMVDSKILSETGLLGAIIAPAEFIMRPNVGITRTRNHYFFNMANKPYNLIFHTINEYSNVILELVVSYTPNNVVNISSCLGDMVNTLKEEVEILQNKLEYNLSNLYQKVS